MGDSDVTKFSKTTKTQLLLEDTATFPNYIQHVKGAADEKTQLTMTKIFTVWKVKLMNLY